MNAFHPVTRLWEFLARRRLHSRSALAAALLAAISLSSLHAPAQDAAPADRNAVNTSARPGGMAADSPVTFPERGALPAKYPPDVREQSEPSEKDYYIFGSPCRSLTQIAAIQKEMPPGQFTPPPPDWSPLQRTRRLLTEGGDLRLLALGDSIVNDTMRSGWVAKLEEAYPKARIEATVYVRGGGGCQHYREEQRVAKYITPRRPDLVFIGGISQKDIASIREVIRQLRAGLPEVEILLATGVFGTVDPRDPIALAIAPHSGTGAYGQALKALATEENCAYLDMTTPWAEYIRSARVHPHLFYRDVVHANEFGEQILAKIMMAFWSPALTGPDPAADAQQAAAAREPLRMSVYATAGDVLRYMATETDCQQVLRNLQPMRISRVFLEGRRGNEYVPPETLRKLRAFFEAHEIQCSGGIATVPGTHFGTRQNEALGWLNWESVKTRQDIAGFFTENAPLFDDLIVDDFFCTADAGPESERGRGQRSWSDYRRDLLVSLIDPIMRQPAHTANPSVKLIIKFPQWYDRFQLFGYDPPRMAAPFDQVWVGTEVRNPKTRRMGYVQPTEGYINFRWLSSVAGEKVIGAWFDHIECTPDNFVDQAFQSVLAGARELTLFHLGDLMEKHPGDTLLAGKLQELFDLAARVRDRSRVGIPFYKPPGSAGDENLYLMDYLTMIGLPILPQADTPQDAPVAVFGVQAAADPDLLRKLQERLEKGATSVLTPALVRKLGQAGSSLCGVEVGPNPVAATTVSVTSDRGAIQLDSPLDVDGSLAATASRVRMRAQLTDGSVPLITVRQQKQGQVFVLSVRTFSEQDFRDTGEWLLSPKPRGLSELPQALTDDIRRVLLPSLGVEFEAPSGVALYLFRGAHAVYNFRDDAALVRLDGKAYRLEAHQCLWIDGQGLPRSRE